MTKIEKNYLLYTDKNQTKLLAQAYTLQEAKLESLNYTEGQWYSYEATETKLYEDTKKSVKIKFGAKTKEKESHTEDSDWNLGGSDIR